MADEKKEKEYDPKTATIRDIKNLPIEVIRTEIPSLAKALGIDVGELVRAIAGVEPAGGPVALGRLAASGDCRCCGNDSW